MRENVVNEDKLVVSSTDFMGLNFSDKKKTRGLPAGLLPVNDPFPDGDLPEVELIVGDRSKFGMPLAPDPPQEDNSDSYKPKVSTWGVFPRPRNISKTVSYMLLVFSALQRPFSMFSLVLPVVSPVNQI